MTTISITEAAILSHLSKRPSNPQRLKLTTRLGPDAKLLAKKLKHGNVGGVVRKKKLARSV